MSRYTSKKGTVINIPDNLGPRQVAKIKADADAGYGTRAQQTAKELSKKVAAKADKKEADNATANQPAPDPNAPNTPVGDPNAGVDPETGAIDPEKLLGSAYTHWNDDRANELRNQAQEAAYSFTTKNYARDKQRAMDEAKQELANRGIPYNPAAQFDPNTKDIYGQTVGGITEHFEGLDKQARDQALLQGNQIYETETSTNRANFDSFVQAALGMSAADLQKYGIDQDKLIALKNIKAQKDIAKMNNKPSGAAPSGNSGGGGGGFEIL